MLNEVEVNSFCKSYGKIKACDGIQFSAEKNAVTGILGRNGAGKSTLLKAVCGILYPASGTVSVCGCERPDEIRKAVAFVPETPELPMNLTVKEILFFEASLFAVPKDRMLSSVEHAVSLCGLKDVLFMKARALSKGFRQRVSLAKAICREPKVLVLDEFSAGLDPSQTAFFRSELKKLSRRMTLIFSTHHTEEAALLCDRIYILSRGAVAACGTAQALMASSCAGTLEEAFIKITEGNSPDESSL